MQLLAAEHGAVLWRSAALNAADHGASVHSSGFEIGSTDASARSEVTVLQRSMVHVFIQDEVQYVKVGLNFSVSLAGA